MNTSFSRGLFYIVLLPLLMACSKSAAPVLSADALILRSHVDFLASDLMQGRDTGSAEYEIAARYVAAEFQKLGLTPGGDGTSYLQAVPLVEATAVPGSQQAVLHLGQETVVLRYPDEFIADADPLEPSATVTAEAVFVGYGIVAPNRQHDDYQGQDVQGKIVVMFSGRPEHWPSEEGAHYSSGRHKARMAAEHGAIGRVIVHTPRQEKTFPYQEALKYINVPDMRFINRDGQPDGAWPQLRRTISLDSGPAKRLFTDTPMSADELFEADMSGGEIPGFPLAASVTMAVESLHRRVSSSNVIGILEGSDPALKDEFVVYTAHLDHLGVIDTEDTEDNVYNGAMDNALGISVLLETARLLSAERKSLKRSVAFVAVTGEERGLLGAGYYVDNGGVDPSQMVANINLDMPVLLYPFADITAYGAEHSTLKASVERALANQDAFLSPDPMPEQAIFVRSDHYRFVLKGVPSIMLESGFESRNPDENGGEIFRGFLKDVYHSPKDDLDLAIDYEAGVRFTDINVAIGREVSNNPSRPQWVEGDFFGQLVP